MPACASDVATWPDPSSDAGLVASGWGWPGPAAEIRSPAQELQEKMMASRLNPYLNFNGNARQALEFYANVFGGNLTLSTFADFGRSGSPDADKIMHGQLETEAGYTIMAADTPGEMEFHPMAGFSVSLSGDDADALHGYWDKLSASGTATMPMQKQVWGDEFGMCVDKFGVSWLVNISQPQA
jgi:PhnB protein